jgi:pyruvate, water dikinase
MQAYVIPFQSLGLTDIPEVGGKNASLGEMISNLSSSGVHVPGGFATTAQAYRDFLAHDGLDKRIEKALATLNVEDVTALAEAGRTIRNWIVEAPLPKRLEEEIRSHYEKLAAAGEGSFAVRSSATAEDLPDASFAGQQETFLNIQGIDNILHAIREVFASLYNDRAISYRVHKDFTHADVALSAGVQRMVRSDLGASGVMFTLDTESGFRDAVFITSSYGLGEMVVQGAVNPDEFYVHKPQLAAGFPAVIRRALGSKQQRMVFDEQRSAGRSCRIEPVPAADQSKFSLSDADVLQLARYAVSIEKHYGRPMDIEWGKDGLDGKLYILQARPETVKSNAAAGGTEKYRLLQRGDVLVEGRAIGQKIGTGRVRIVASTVPDLSSLYFSRPPGLACDLTVSGRACRMYSLPSLPSLPHSISIGRP